MVFGNNTMVVKTRTEEMNTEKPAWAGKLSDDDEDMDFSSPTRVSEFETDDGDSSSQEGSSYLMGPSELLDHRGRRSALPTLDEVSSSEMSPCCSLEDDHREKKDSRKHVSGTQEAFQEYSLVSPESRDGEREELSTDVVEYAGDNRDVNKSRHDQVMDLKATASELALGGNEEDAIRTYKRALRMTRLELARIREQVKLVANEPKEVRQSIHMKLHDDWLEIALIIAEIRTLMAILYERLGDYHRAISCCNEARTVYARQARFEEKHDSEVKVAQENVQRMTHMLEQMEVARDSFLERKEFHSEAVRLRALVALTADPVKKEELYDQVYDNVFSALELESSNLGEAHPQVADTMGLLSELFLERNEIEQALKYMHRAVTITELSLGSTHPRTGAKLRELARIYERRRRGPEDEDLAIEYYEKAIEVFRNSCVDQARLTGSTLNDVAVIHIQRGEYDVAVEKLSDALTSYESAVSSGASLSSDTAQVWRNLGECYSRRKEFDNAVTAFRSALEVQRDARRLYEAAVASASAGEDDRQMPKQPLLVDDESIGDTLKRLGKVTASLSRYDEAIEIFEEALVIHKEALLSAMSMNEDGKPNVDLSSKQDQVAHTLYCIAEVHEALESDRAMILFQESLQLRLFSDALRGDKRVNMVHCAMCLAGIGGIHCRRGEFDDACKVFEDALEFTDAHGIASNHKIVKMIKRRLQSAKEGQKKLGGEEHELTHRGGSWDSSGGETCTSQKTQEMIDKTTKLDQKARDLMEAGDFDGATKTLVNALAVRRKRLMKQLKKGNTDCEKEREDIARTLGNFGTILTVKGEYPQAELLFTEAVRMYITSGKSEEDECVAEILYVLEQLKARKES